jgi:hypothetical protein
MAVQGHTIVDVDGYVVVIAQYSSPGVMKNSLSNSARRCVMDQRRPKLQADEAIGASCVQLTMRGRFQTKRRKLVCVFRALTCLDA